MLWGGPKYSVRFIWPHWVIRARFSTEAETPNAGHLRIWNTYSVLQFWMSDNLMEHVHKEQELSELSYTSTETLRKLVHFFNGSPQDWKLVLKLLSPSWVFQQGYLQGTGILKVGRLAGLLYKTACIITTGQKPVMSSKTQIFSLLGEGGVRKVGPEEQNTSRPSASMEDVSPLHRHILFAPAWELVQKEAPLWGCMLTWRKGTKVWSGSSGLDCLLQWKWCLMNDDTREPSQYTFS